MCPLLRHKRACYSLTLEVGRPSLTGPFAATISIASVKLRQASQVHPLPRGQRGLIQRQPDDALANLVWNAVPDAIRLGMSIAQGFRPTGLVQIVPAVEGGARNANLFQRPSHWQGRLLDRPDDLKLLGGGYLMWRPSHPPSRFF
jgi:hypothetical protein